MSNRCRVRPTTRPGAEHAAAPAVGRRRGSRGGSPPTSTAAKLRRVHGVRSAARIAACAPEREAEDLLQQVREPEIAAEGPMHEAAVVGAGRDRLRREHPGLDRLRDAFAGHRVDDPRGVAREEHAAVHETGRFVARRDRPRVHRLRRAARRARGCRARRGVRAAGATESFSSRPLRPSDRNTP